MSLGRYDPNAAKLRYIPPEQYERNLANIAQAKATIETFEKMNDEGRRRHEQMQKEELELERRVQEGLLARCACLISRIFLTLTPHKSTTTAIKRSEDVYVSSTLYELFPPNLQRL